ncbi:F-box only protein 41 [Labeo rohita]|uniref:F-box only protein 41 n=1 Tax=Labeo rohita TaxID=84645 RepID=A0ABQ8MZL1_LABRO|nr:F-box only protein 41 [Labeo rohita]
MVSTEAQASVCVQRHFLHRDNSCRAFIGCTRTPGICRMLEEINKEVAQIDQFLQETAAREANAKVRLQQFIEELLDRADRAEKQLQIISSCATTPNGSLGHCSLQGSKPNGRQRNSSLSGASRGMYQVCDRRSSPSTAASGRGKSVSQGSGGYDSDSVDLHALEDCPDAQYYHVQCRLGEGGGGGGGYERAAASRSWGLRKQAIQNWQRRPYRNSTEGEEGDVSDVGSRTTESEAEMWEQDRRAESQHGGNRGGYRLATGRSEGGYKPCRHEKSPSKVNEVISPEVLKIRAALFCIFTYLDTKTLLQAAEVCRDWKFVARHPAVWTRVLLENARISSKFLCILSQWCTQTHSLILQNLKPRQRGKKETKEEYLKSTRGCLEEGLEALLKATGSNLLILKVSHCPNLLTDRSLWLASCYCRALQAVTYRRLSGHWELVAETSSHYRWRLCIHARNCMRLQVLELDHVSEINQEVAAEMCREGLKGLEMLVLTSTPVTPKALLHFNSVCRNLKSIVVQIGIEDYFEDPNSPEARKLFDEMVNKLQRKFKPNDEANKRKLFVSDPPVLQPYSHGQGHSGKGLLLIIGSVVPDRCLLHNVPSIAQTFCFQDVNVSISSITCRSMELGLVQLNGSLLHLLF